MTCRKNLPVLIAIKYSLVEVEINAEEYSIVVAANYENFQNILPVEHEHLSSYKSGMVLVINYLTFTTNN